MKIVHRVRVRISKQAVIESYSCVDRLLARDPVNRAFNLAVATAGAAPRVGIVAAAQLNDISGLVFY